MGGNLIDALLLFASESPQTLAAQGIAGAASFLPSQMVRAFITDSKAKRVSVNPLQTPALVRVFITDLKSKTGVRNPLRTPELVRLAGFEWVSERFTSFCIVSKNALF